MKYLILFLITWTASAQQVQYKSQINIVETNHPVIIHWMSASDQSFKYLLDKYVVFIDPDKNIRSNTTVSVKFIAEKNDFKRVIETFICRVGDDIQNHLYTFIEVNKGEITYLEVSINEPGKFIFDIFSKERQSKAQNSINIVNPEVIYTENKAPKKIKYKEKSQKQAILKILHTTTKIISSLL